MPDRSIVKTECDALPVGRVARGNALKARPLRHRMCRSGLAFLFSGMEDREGTRNDRNSDQRLVLGGLHRLRPRAVGARPWRFPSKAARRASEGSIALGDDMGVARVRLRRWAVLLLR